MMMMIMIMEQSVESLPGVTEAFGENLPRCHIAHLKSHIIRPVLEPGPLGWEAGD
jgi:hypothetical protein